MVVHLAGDEVADHEAAALEDLVHRRRLVHLARQRHEVGDVEHVGVEAAVPADHVEGVVRHEVDRAGDAAGAVAAVLEVDLDAGARRVVARVVGEERLGGHAQVALAVRRVLQELALRGEIPLRRADVAVGLDDVEPGGLGAGDPAVDDGAGDEHVVALGHVEGAQLGLDAGRAAFDVDQLVAQGVLVQRRIAPRHDVRQPHVGVAEQQAAAADRVDAGGGVRGEEVVRPQVPRQQGRVGGQGLVRELPAAGADDRGRDAPVVEQRGVGGEALLADEFLIAEGALLVGVHRVPMAGDRPDLAVIGHNCLLGGDVSPATIPRRVANASTKVIKV